MVVEKPFGRDLAVGRRSSTRCLHRRRSPRTSIFRIDHFLGKEAVENLLVFRFANSLLEPVWNRNFISQRADHDGRGVRRRRAAARSTRASARCATWCRTTSCRSWPCWRWSRPSAPTQTPARREGQAASARSAPFDPAHGRARPVPRSYKDADGVDPDSDTETFVAARFEIDSWRWAGVPWLVRAGKGLRGHRHRGGRRVHRAAAPAVHRRTAPDAPAPNHLRFRLGNDDGIMLHLQAKAPGDELVTQPVDLEVSYDEAFGHREEAYQRLLEDAIDGDARRFGRADALDEQWRIVEPLLVDPPRVHLYDEGQLGPDEADALAADIGGWVVPIAPGRPVQGTAPPH